MLVSHFIDKYSRAFGKKISRIADRAMDIFGDQGYLTKSYIEIFLRDVRLYRLFEGTSEIQRMVISRNLLKDPCR